MILHYSVLICYIHSVENTSYQVVRVYVRCLINCYVIFSDLIS